MVGDGWMVDVYGDDNDDENEDEGGDDDTAADDGDDAESVASFWLWLGIALDQPSHLSPSNR